MNESKHTPFGGKLLNWLFPKKQEVEQVFPKNIDRLWLAGERGLYKYKMPYFKNQEYQRYKMGQVVHLLTKGNLRGFYTITKIEKPCGDYAGWDDGKKYWFEFAYSKRKYAK